MDRVSRKFTIIFTFMLSLPVWAGTVLYVAPASVPSETKAEVFPDSRFGAAPAPMKTGTESSYVAWKDDRWDDAVYGRGRQPAGLMMDAEASKHQVPADSTFTRSKNTAERAPDPAIEAKAELNAMVTGAKGVQEIALIAGDLGYFPKTFFVNRDIPVRLYVTGASRNTLCIMMDSFQVRKQVRSQKIEEIIFTPSVPGKFRFYCPVNGMEGTMIVRELASNLSSE